MNKPDPNAAGTPQPDTEEGSGFLGRWSRRKAAAREPSPAEQPQPPDAGQSQKVEPEEVPVDPATLPPIESLTAESDFTVFLRKGVPESLRKSALQKLWRTEPSVVNYVPLVEYNWDFNAPGYGALRPTDDVAKLARAAWGQIAEPAQDKEGIDGGTEPPSSLGAEPPRLSSEPAMPDTAQGPIPLDSAGDRAERPPSNTDEKPRAARRHGGALPT